MTPKQWNYALRPEVPHVEAYQIIAPIARDYLMQHVLGGDKLFRYELVEALYPMRYAKQTDEGAAARKRIANALTMRALGTYGLADCMTEGPEQWIPALNAVGRLTLWHPPIQELRA